MAIRKRWYVGIAGRNRTAFASAQKPTADTCPAYHAVVGPFRTKRAAVWVENNGYNGWYQNVNNAERLAAQQHPPQQRSAYRGL